MSIFSQVWGGCRFYLVIHCEPALRIFTFWQPDDCLCPPAVVHSATHLTVRTSWFSNSIKCGSLPWTAESELPNAGITIPPWFWRFCELLRKKKCKICCTQLFILILNCLSLSRKGHVSLVRLNFECKLQLLPGIPVSLVKAVFLSQVLTLSLLPSLPPPSSYLSGPTAKSKLLLACVLFLLYFLCWFYKIGNKERS